MTEAVKDIPVVANHSAEEGLTGGLPAAALTLGDISSTVETSNLPRPDGSTAMASKPEAEVEIQSGVITSQVPNLPVSRESPATTAEPEPQTQAQANILTSSTSAADIAAESSPPTSSYPSLTTTLDAYSQLDVSTTSSVSSVSGRSTSSRLSDSAASVKKRGYARPQATTFAESAKARDSVMSLGSIAHLQYYFARTGLLDGKGAQFAKKTPDFKRVSMQRSSSMGAPPLRIDLNSSPDESMYALSDSGALLESPIDQNEEADWNRELALLPPTVSTYNVRPAYVPPPPDNAMLRRELTEALEDALKVVKESDKSTEDAQGWYEIQGLHLLDITTLAIRAAKNYYTAHSQYQRLHSIKSEREIRSELYQVLELLKRMAARNFAGGLRQAEKVGILTWIVGISELIQTEIDQEKKEAEAREKWLWRTGDWTGRERKREYEFIKSFIETPENLPEWTEPPSTDDDADSLPTPFLKYLQSGLQLVKLHNALVLKSRRQFEEIKVFHTDTAKPYRCAENLRFWIKAAQLRWEVNLALNASDVMGVVQGTLTTAWRRFDAALLQWAKVVREELSADLEQPESNGKRSPPRLMVEAEPAGPVGPESKRPGALRATTV